MMGIMDVKAGGMAHDVFVQNQSEPKGSGDLGTIIGQEGENSSDGLPLRKQAHDQSWLLNR